MAAARTVVVPERVTLVPVKVGVATVVPGVGDDLDRKRLTHKRIVDHLHDIPCGVYGHCDRAAVGKALGQVCSEVSVIVAAARRRKLILVSISRNRAHLVQHV